MKYTATIDRLCGVIERELNPLITSDYYLLECPYYSNIGDTLIWQGELDFLARLPFRMLGFGSYQTWDFRTIPAEATILLQGGGNFGDLWRDVQDFRLKVIRRYPKNKIVVFPQTCFYQDHGLLVSDAALMARHPDLTICVRDHQSVQLLLPHFQNRVLLLPDMAFCLDVKAYLPVNQTQAPGKSLYLQRNDKELKNKSVQIPGDVEVHDWPTLERLPQRIFWLYKLSGLSDRLARAGMFTDLRQLLVRQADCLAYRRVRPDNIRKGVAFLSQYETVYSTRLHGMILSLLLGVPNIYFLDNSYGKNRSFYETWLSDTEGLSFIDYNPTQTSTALTSESI